jgi:hypothetical protein
MDFEMGSRSLGTQRQGTGALPLLSLTLLLITGIHYEIKVKLTLLTILKVLNFQHLQSRSVGIPVP